VAFGLELATINIFHTKTFLIHGSLTHIPTKLDTVTLQFSAHMFSTPPADTPRAERSTRATISDRKTETQDTEEEVTDTLQESSCDRSTPYSAFSKAQKIIIVSFVTAAGIFSPLTAYVYFPALRTLSRDYGVSIELINLTVTAYLIAQAIAPSIIADLSEKLGRRPTYIFAISIYCAASVGLIFQRNYGALLVLRMLQSAGSAPTVSLAFGVIGDIAAPHERGVYVGASHIGFNFAPALGPTIGGLITEKAGWPWIFVFLAALSGLLLVLMLFFLHETSRSVVGNGGKTATGMNRTLTHILRHGRSAKEMERVKLRAPNILPCFTMMFHKGTFPLLAAYSVFYMMYSVLQATTAPLFESVYGLTPLQAGLCYLAYGIAGGTASVCARRQHVLLDSCSVTPADNHRISTYSE
jgi:multidrug resistance protein